MSANVDVESITNSLRQLGIPVSAGEIQTEDRPTIRWEDIDSFLDSAHRLHPAVAYVTTTRFDDFGDLDESDIKKLGAVAMELRRRIGENVGCAAYFTSEGTMHEYFFEKEEYSRLVDMVMESDDEEDEESSAAADRFWENRSEWLERAYQLLVGDTQYLLCRNSGERFERAGELINREFGGGHWSPYGWTHYGWQPAIERVKFERKSIVDARRTIVRDSLPSLSEELAKTSAFQLASTKAARRAVAREFLAEREPLAVNGELTVLLESAAQMKVQ